MSGFGILIIMAVVFASIFRGASKTAQKRPGQPDQPAQRRPGQPGQSAQRQPGAHGPARTSAPRPQAANRPQTTPAPAPEWQERFPPELRKILGMDDAEPKQQTHAAPEPAPVGEGSSRVEPDGCIGGSLPHSDEPPITPARSRVRSKARQPKRAEPAAATDVPRPVRAPDALRAGDLRRAVIMAEVLAKPVSLRPYGYRAI